MCERSKRPAARAHGAVLLDDGAVADGHLPAAEAGEARAQREVPLVERGALQRGRVRSVSRASTCRSTGPQPPAATGRARATMSRSVAKLMTASASARSNQRTSSNSWSWPARSPPVDLHQEVVHGLLDAPAAAHEAVVDVAHARRGCAPPGRSPRGPRAGRSARGSRRRPACPWAATRWRRPARGGGGPGAPRGRRASRAAGRRPRRRRASPSGRRPDGTAPPQAVRDGARQRPRVAERPARLRPADRGGVDGGTPGEPRPRADGQAAGRPADRAEGVAQRRGACRRRDAQAGCASGSRDSGWAWRPPPAGDTKRVAGERHADGAAAALHDPMVAPLSPPAGGAVRPRVPRSSAPRWTAMASSRRASAR